MEFFALLPQTYVVIVIFLLGCILGSFLDVLVSRFHTGKSINGRSRCMSCGHTLSWYELFPLLSYLILLGKCKSCRGHIPLRLLYMELIAGTLFIFVYFYSVTLLSLLFGLALVCVLLVIAQYDMRHMIIPHEFVFAVLGFSIVYIGYESYSTQSLQVLLPHLVSGIASFLFFYTLWLISKGKWIGKGDSKLALPLGLMLVPYEAFSFVVLSFWVGAGISLILLGIQKLCTSGQIRLPFIGRGLTMKSEVPFAPFMLVAFILVFFAQVNVFALMLHFIS